MHFGLPGAGFLPSFHNRGDQQCAKGLNIRRVNAFPVDCQSLRSHLAYMYVGLEEYGHFFNIFCRSYLTRSCSVHECVVGVRSSDKALKHIDHTKFNDKL